MTARPHRIGLALAAVALVGAGAAACGSGPHDAAAGPTTTLAGRTPTTHSPRAPTTHAARPKPGPERPVARPQPAPPKVTFPASLPRSIPTSVTIPAIGVQSRTIRLGLNSDGSVQTPPSSPEQITGWFERSPTPGELGAPSVILGHIDSHRYGPEVFWRLHELEPGDVIEVGRQDGTTAKFSVDRVAEYPKAQFPKVEVYGGGSSLNHPGIRLITCGGAFDAAERSYLDNIVVYASLMT